MNLATQVADAGEMAEALLMILTYRGEAK